MTDLEQLSRDAAKVLHTEKTEFSWQHYSHTSERYIGKIVLPRHKWDGCLMWLHESTEACADIMVLVLWPKGVWLDYANASGRNPSIVLMPIDALDEFYKDNNNDPMQAFRTAVLRALIEVKK